MAASIEELKEELKKSINGSPLTREALERFIDEAQRITAGQQLILNAAVKNAKRVTMFDSHFYDVVLQTGERVIYPSSTTILGIINKPWLIHMMKQLGVEEMEERLRAALAAGALVHYATMRMDQGWAILYRYPEEQNPDPELTEQNIRIEEICKSASVPYYIVRNQEAMVMVERYERIVDVLKPELLGIEQIVVSVKHRYAGTLDRRWRVKAGEYPLNGSKTVVIPKDGTAIFDLKTGTEDTGYAKQVASYAEAVEESLGEQVDYCITGYVDAKTRGENEGIRVVVAGRDEWKKDFEGFLHAHWLWYDQNADKIPKVRDFRSVIYRPITNVIQHGDVLPNRLAREKLMEAINADSGLTAKLGASTKKRKV
jgi:hypothetical protein